MPIHAVARRRGMLKTRGTSNCIIYDIGSYSTSQQGGELTTEGLSQLFIHKAPVDHIPPRGDVGRSLRAVQLVVRVLCNITRVTHELVSKMGQCEEMY
jgi:hypothetical protein